MSKCPVCNNGEGGMLVRRYESCPSCDGAPPAPLDEARMREILAGEMEKRGMISVMARVEGRGPSNPGVDAQIEGALAAMSRAISEACAEQIELDAKIADYFAEIYWDLSPAKSAAAATAAAIRSQDNPNKQVDG